MNIGADSIIDIMSSLSNITYQAENIVWSDVIDGSNIEHAPLQSYVYFARHGVFSVASVAQVTATHTI